MPFPLDRSLQEFWYVPRGLQGKQTTEEKELLGKPKSPCPSDCVRARGWVGWRNQAKEKKTHNVEIILPEVFGLKLVALNTGNNCLLSIYRFTINLYLEKELKRPKS